MYFFFERKYSVDKRINDWKNPSRKAVYFVNKICIYNNSGFYFLHLTQKYPYDVDGR